MNKIKLEFQNSTGETLAGLLELPERVGEIVGVQNWQSRNVQAWIDEAQDLISSSQQDDSAKIKKITEVINQR